MVILKVDIELSQDLSLCVQVIESSKMYYGTVENAKDCNHLSHSSEGESADDELPSLAEESQKLLVKESLGVGNGDDVSTFDLVSTSSFSDEIRNCAMTDDRQTSTIEH